MGLGFLTSTNPEMGRGYPTHREETTKAALFDFLRPTNPPTDAGMIPHEASCGLLFTVFFVGCLPCVSIVFVLWFLIHRMWTRTHGNPAFLRRRHRRVAKRRRGAVGT